MKNKKLLKYLALISLLTPQVVFAKTKTSIFEVIIVSIFALPFIWLGVSTLSKALSDDNKTKEKIYNIVIISIIVLLFFIGYLNLGYNIYFVEFIFIFVWVFAASIISSNIEDSKKNKINKIIQNVTNPISNIEPIKEEMPEKIQCPNCSALVESVNNYCYKCGCVLKDKVTPIQPPQKVLSISDFDNIYSGTEEATLEKFIQKELNKTKDLNINEKNLIPRELFQRKMVFTTIFSVLLATYVSLVFFHFPLFTYIIGGIILIILLTKTRQITLMQFLTKQVKSRPNEKISNIVMSIKATSVNDNKITYIGIICLGLIIPFIIFSKPKIIYEKAEDGYAVRFYAYGWNNSSTVEIPSEYKGKPVVELRGNTFSNMKKLESVKLPDTIKRIRGQAFKNDTSLKEVNIPKNLEYLGGSAFYNCTSIEEIILPDTLTEMGGEVFSGATSLTKVKISENLTELRGNTFEECTSLETIDIPAKVTRIGGSAFAGAKNLTTVNFSPNSELKEIGGSAFKDCSKLKNIIFPEGIEILGGASFSNCYSLTEITIPDSVTEMGGEIFMNDIQIKTVKLSVNIPEIRGDSFSGCTSLEKIDIPDKVTRIGGHAFYGTRNLSQVYVSPNSQLKEIGSSAFRGCRKLQSIMLPKSTYVNEKAFKDSPTKVRYYTN